MVESRLRVPDEIAVRVPQERMRATVTDVFGALGLDGDDAALAADVLVWADIRGVDSHGVSNMMPYYVAGLRQGTINPRPAWSVTREAPATATIDCDRGLGLVVGPHAMNIAIEKARQCGIGAVAAGNGRHFGAAGYHAAMALPHDMIGISMTVGGLSVPPTFGAKAMVGLNPLAVAAPARYQPPFVFDASMSTVAGNKIRIARRLGATVGPGWIATMDGTPVMEEGPVPEEFQVLPLGGTRTMGSHKGYSLAMMVDILSGVLSGTGPGFLNTGSASHHFIAYRIDAFTDLEKFKDDMDVYLRGLRETEPAPGFDRVVYAGLGSYESEQERRELGIPYHPDVVAYYRELARELGTEDRLG
jgi:LDH2 family malate/lactate/ureidoglycolate dehydrogenase